MSSSTLTVLTVAEILALVIVLAISLIQVRRRLHNIATALQTLAGALASVEDHLRLIGPAVGRINAPLQAIVGALPGIAGKAEIVARR